MSDIGTKGKRIARNTIVLYFRMIFLMLVNLYTSRVILDALGVEDYGIYNIVGGFVSMFGLISAALTSASSRFLNYEMGKGNAEHLAVVFSTIVIIQWTLAFIVALLAECIGIWYINNIMVVPSERFIAAKLCFHFSVFNFCMNIITIPYNACIIAHERMKTFAYVSVFQGLGTLVVSYLVYIAPFDKLISYALMLLVIQFTVRMLYQFYCKKNFKECQFKRVFDFSLFKSILSYSTWHLVGNGAAILKNHGVNVILNYFTGPIVNAARGIAIQVDTAVSQFSGNFMIAINPQITQSYARGEYDYMNSLIMRGSRYSFYLLLFVSLPIIYNAEYILNLWLKEVPYYTIEFVQFSLVAALINCISRPLITAQNATGNVKKYQLVVGSVNLLNLPLCYITLRLGYSPLSTVIVLIIVEIIALFTRVFMLPQTLNSFSRILFIRKVLLNCGIVMILSVAIPMLIKLLIENNTFLSFVLLSLSCIVSTLFIVLFIGLKKTERIVIKNKINKTIKKLN